MSAIPYPALRLDAGGRVTAANALATAAFPSDPIGRPFASLFDDDLPSEPAALAERLGDGAPLSIHAAEGQARFEARAQAWDGGALVVLVSLSVHDARPIDVDLLAKAVDAANNSIVIADLTRDDHPLVYANEYFLSLTGYEADEVLGRNCRFLQVRDGDRDDAGDGQGEALDAIRHGIRAAEPVGGIVLRNYTKDGRLFYNELYLTPITDAAGRTTHMIGVQNDVTDRVEAERERDRQLRYLRGIFAASAVPLGLLERGADGALVHVLRNEAATNVLGLGGAEGAGLRADGPAAEEDWARAAEAVERTGEPTRFDTELDGRTYEVVVSPVAADVGRDGPARFLYLATDVTEGRAAAEDLLHVSNRQPKQIAQDVHDGVGQSLVGASMLATALARDLGGTDRAPAADQLRALIARALAQLRSFALGLDPLDLEDLGAADALGRLAADAQGALGVRIEVVDALGPVQMADDVLLDVYRIAQEALTNAARHGEASSVRLTLRCGPAGRLVLDVDDDGRGIAAGDRTGGMGLRTMRARAVRHGGTLTVNPRTEGGTRVRLELPPERLVPTGDGSDGEVLRKA